MRIFLEIIGMLIAVGACYGYALYRYKHVYNNSDIRLSIDLLPIPVYFGLPNKLPLVVNNKMYDLIYSLNGKPLTDMKNDFDCLMHNHIGEDVIEEKLEEKYRNNRFVRFEDRIYLIEKKEFDDKGEPITQITGQDITEEYDRLAELRNLNDRIREQNTRLKEHFKNIAIVNREKELLNAKINIHAKLGESLSLSRLYLSQPEDNELKAKTLGLWEQIILGYTDTNIQSDSSLKGYDEIRRVSNLVGCSLDIIGELPAGDTVPFMTKLLREALNNSIRHANATALTVDMTGFKASGTVRIYDNGKPVEEYTKPGGGLSSLQEDFEQNGIIMNIHSEQRFEIELIFPERFRLSGEAYV